MLAEVAVVEQGVIPIQSSASSCCSFSFSVTPRALPCTTHPSSVPMAPQEVSAFPAFAEVENFLGFIPLHLFASFVFSVGSSWFGGLPSSGCKTSLWKFSPDADFSWFMSVNAGSRLARFPATLLHVSCIHVYNPVYCLTVQKIPPLHSVSLSAEDLDFFQANAKKHNLAVPVLRGFFHSPNSPSYDVYKQLSYLIYFYSFGTPRSSHISRWFLIFTFLAFFLIFLNLFLLLGSSPPSNTSHLKKWEDQVWWVWYAIGITSKLV